LGVSSIGDQKKLAEAGRAPTKKTRNWSDAKIDRCIDISMENIS
jgi:hypothetical protein